MEKNYWKYWELTNCNFSDLKSGMKVRYTVEKDEERGKREEMPCCRATKVTVVDFWASVWYIGYTKEY